MYVPNKNNRNLKWTDGNNLALWPLCFCVYLLKMMVYSEYIYIYLYLYMKWYDNLDSCHALRWGNGEPWFVGAVIIDHVVHTNPSISSSLVRCELTVCSSFPPIVRVGSTIWRSWHGASFNVEVLIVCIEWCFAPIYLLQTTPRRPVIGFPQGWIHSHRLRFWVWNPFGFVILVHSNWHLIHRETYIVQKSFSL